MISCDWRSLLVALLLTALPMGFALAGGSSSRGGALGGGVGAAGTGSAAVGGGAPAGAVGGGAPAGAVGGGSPGSSNPAGNGSAGTGSPSRNAVGLPVTSPNPPTEIPSARTTGGFIFGAGVSSAPAPAAAGGASPTDSSNQPAANEPASNQPASGKGPTAPAAVHGVAEEASFSPTGLSRPGPDGVSTVTVAARPCGVAAHETDGTTTCVGISSRRRR
jgi:hypothetical protein